MKKIFVSVSLISLVLMLSSCLSISHDWKPEEKRAIYEQVFDTDIYDSLGKHLFDACDVDGISGTLVAVCNGRLYFIYTTGFYNKDADWETHIVSVDKNGHNVKKEYSGVVCSRSCALNSFGNLANIPRNNEKYGFLLNDGRIYLSGDLKTLSFNLSTGEVSEAELPQEIYSKSISPDHQIVSIKDNSSLQERNLTIGSLAESSEYFALIDAESKENTWDGTPRTESFFEKVSEIDGNIYLTCYIYNYGGELTVLLFRYDFDQDRAFYISSKHNVDSFNGYSFALEY